MLVEVDFELFGFVVIEVGGGLYDVGDVLYLFFI